MNVIYGPIFTSFMAELKFTEPIADDKEDAAFLKAIDVVLSTGKRDYPNFVGGLKVASGMIVDVHSPIDQTIIFGSFQEPDDGLADRAVEVAKGTYGAWNRKVIEDKVAIFQKVLAGVRQQRFRLAAMAALSAGLTKKNALAEVDTLIDILEKACEDSKKKKRSEGVWGILTSYNSPLAAPIGYAAAAMMAGNTVVLVPSVHSIVPVCTVYEMFVDAGLPDGALNIIFDSTPKTATDVANNLDVAGVVAAGLGKKMEDLMFIQTDDELKFINEIKGMNPILVYKPSNMRNAAKAVLSAAFGQGMNVMACSKVVIMAGEEEAFVNAIMAEANNIRVADPSDVSAYMGPMISKTRLKEFLGLIDSVSSNVIFGGKVVSDELTENGYYVMPAIVMGLDEEHDLNIMDSAFPILSIQTAENLDGAIELINCSEYGSSAGIITKDENAASRFKKEINAENIFVNDSSSLPGTASQARVNNFTA